MNGGVLCMKKCISKIVKFFAKTSWRTDVYSRDGRIVKGFCKITWHKLMIARISTLIDSDGMVTIVRREGILYWALKNKIEHILLDALEDSEFKSKLQNSFYINHVDFQYL